MSIGGIRTRACSIIALNSICLDVITDNELARFAESLPDHVQIDRCWAVSRMTESLNGKVPDAAAVTEDILTSAALRQAERPRIEAGSKLRVPNRLFGPTNLARAVLDDRADIRYWVMVGLRAFYR